MRDLKQVVKKPRTAFQSLAHLLTIENSIIVLFSVLGIIGILNHEMWRDEMQAWLLAKDSSSLADLIRNSRYEGHPLLWHICLYGLAKITHNPLIMQCFHLLLATCSVVLVVKASVFSLFQKGLLSFSYFLFYEYSIISRNYAIGVLLAFLFCSLYTRCRPRYGLLSILLALLANANVFGLFISFALGTAMLYRLRVELKPPMGSLMRYAALLSAGWGLSICQVARALIDDTSPANLSLAAKGAPVNFENAVVPSDFWDKMSALGKLAELILKSYLPLPEIGVNFWNQHLLLNNSLFPQVGSLSLGLWIGVVIATTVVTISLKILWKTPLYLWVYVVASGLMAVFHSVIFRGTTRHYGHFFIIFLISLWLSIWSQTQQRRGRAPYMATSQTTVFGSTFLTGLLIFQVISGLHAYTIDLLYPFSASRATAEFIQTHQLEDVPLFSEEDRHVVGIAGYLDRPIYYAQRQSFGSFWGGKYPDLKSTQLAVDSIEVFAQQQPDFLAILEHPIDPTAVAENVVELARFNQPTIQKDERFYLYRVRDR